MKNDTSFKVLVADDEYWIRENLRSLLDWQEHSFCFLEPVEDGEQALEAISKEQPDIVITDINMPLLTGTELIIKVREKHPEIVFIALSGYSDYDNVRSALVAGAVDYLLKPITKVDLLDILVKAVDTIVDGRKQLLEQKSIQEKLRIASMSAIDRELSQLIRYTSDKKQSEQVQLRLMEYDLDFYGFTLVVFRTAGLSRMLRNMEKMGLDELIARIKDLILSKVPESKNLVFNNIYKSNEFILISETDSAKLGKPCECIIKILKDLTGYPTIVLIGRHYFSFSNIRDAYNDAQLSLLAEDFLSTDKVMRVSKIENWLDVERLGTEQKKHLQHAVLTGNRHLFEKVLFEDVKLQDCAKDRWRFAEVRLVSDSIIWSIRSALAAEASASQLFAIDNLAELLQFAIDSFDIEEMNSAIEQILDEIFESESQPRQSEGMRETVKQVRKHIDAHYFEDLSLNTLSKQFFVDSSYLSKAFKLVVGDNMMLYIAKKRIVRAKEYLKQSEMSITEISQLVGYGDYAYFSRVFRKLTGISPREFRERG